MKSITQHLEDHFINFMMNDGNAGTFMFAQLWQIEFNEGGRVLVQANGNITLSGDNGILLLDELTMKNLTN